MNIATTYLLNSEKVASEVLRYEKPPVPAVPKDIIILWNKSSPPNISKIISVKVNTIYIPYK